MAEKYLFEGREVQQVWESFDGDYWIITELAGDDRAHPFGYARLAGHARFAEWGSIDGSIIDSMKVWQVEREAWSYTGPEDIDIEKA